MRLIEELEALSPEEAALHVFAAHSFPAMHPLAASATNIQPDTVTHDDLQ